MADKKKDQTNAAEPAEERVSQDAGSWRTQGTSKPSSNKSSSGASGSSGGSSGSYTPAGAGSDYYMNEAGMSPEDQAALKAAGDRYNNATTDEERAAAHAQAEGIRGKYGYSGGADGSEYIETGAPEKQQVQPFTAPVPDLSGMTDMINSGFEAAKKQQENRIDYATQKGIDELTRAEEDAQEQFQTQQDQIDENEAKALDNQALYAEARGDRGGIGHAQYGQIQATAMTNRRAVNSARIKLATDTARQIADLRAQGEFQKADAILQLTQTYLGQLVDLQKWGAEYTLDVAQFNAGLQQWAAEFELAVSDVTGMYQGSPTMSAQKANQSTLANSGLAALAVGIRPSPEQQAAMGYTDAQIDAELAAYNMAQSAGVKYTGGGDPTPVGNPAPGSPVSGLNAIFADMFSANLKTENDAYHYLREAGYTAGDAERYSQEYMEKLDSGDARTLAYDSLGVPAREALGAIQRANSRSGVKGLTSGQQKNLEELLTGGKISEDELDTILAILGY